MSGTFNGNLCTPTLSYYSPTNANDETVINTFYNALSSLVQHILKHNTLIIGGDMNAHKDIAGNNTFCLHHLPNRNGEYLAEFSWQNTNFQKRKG